MSWRDFSASEHIAAKREQYRRRPLIVRIGLMLFGLLLAVPGLILIIPLPELGAPLLLGTLGLWALQFDWALRLLVRLEQGLRRLFARLKSRK